MEGDSRVRIVDDLGGLELIEAVHRRPHFARHAHSTYALGVVHWGANRFRYRGAFHTAGAGALCTVTPDEAHAVEPAGDAGFAYLCLYPPVELMRLAAESVGGRRLTRTLALPPVIEDAVMARRIRALFEAEAAGAPRLAREAQLLALLARAVVRHATAPVAPGARAPPAAAILRARDYLAGHYAENVSLTRLAAAVDLDPFALLRGFSRAYGLPPHTWLLQERVRRARALLRAGLSPSRVAAEVGFSDQSHLTRHFKRILGITPGRYRRAAPLPLEAPRPPIFDVLGS
jgi:AraC-like DNA-binding protein